MVAALPFSDQMSKFMPRTMKEHSYATLAQAHCTRDLPVVRTFNVCEPKELAFLRPKFAEHSRHIEPQGNIGTGGSNGRPRFFRGAALPALFPPVIHHEVGSDSKQKCPVVLGVVGRWSRTQEA